jgi:hypothetical protein
LLTHATKGTWKKGGVGCDENIAGKGTARTDVKVEHPLPILERCLAKLAIAVDVIVQRFAKEVQTMEMMQALHIRGIAAPVFARNLDLVFCQSGFRG